MKIRLSIKNRWLAAVVMLIAFLFSLNKELVDNQPITKITPTSAPVNNIVKVISVVDGDTIVIDNNQRLRYIGIDTPETVDPRRPVMCFGKEASDKNKELVEGKTVRLEKDVSEVDKYGRLLRYVWVDDIFINDYLVRQGYARVSTYPPDVKYSQQFLDAEREARENNRGLWSSCPL